MKIERSYPKNLHNQKKLEIVASKSLSALISTYKNKRTIRRNVFKEFKKKKMFHPKI
jgi:hypothetical protein